MEEEVYLNISFGRVSASEADALVTAIIKLRGTRMGMSVTYLDADAIEDDE